MDRTSGLAIKGHGDDEVVKAEELSKLKCLLGGREWDSSKRAKRRSEEWDPIGPLISSRGGGNHVRSSVRFGRRKDVRVKVGGESFIKPPKIVGGASVDSKN